MLSLYHGERLPYHFYLSPGFVKDKRASGIFYRYLSRCPLSRATATSDFWQQERRSPVDDVLLQTRLQTIICFSQYLFIAISHLTKEVTLLNP
jgi:hypothetical protein